MLSLSMHSELSDNNQTQLYHQDYGSGQPIIFIHGWLMSNESWEKQIPFFLENGYRCITYDRRGAGNSDAPLKGYSYDDLAQDLYSLIEELSLDNVVLIGFSMGSGEIMRYLSRYGSSKISKAVIIGGIIPTLKDYRTTARTLSTTAEKILTEIKNDRAHFTLNYIKSVYGYSKIQEVPSDAFIQWQFHLGMQSAPYAVLQCAETFMNADFTVELQSIDIPVLLLHGDHDRNVNIEDTSQVAADIIPHSEFIMYQGAPHALFYTHHNLVNKDILNFIKD